MEYIKKAAAFVWDRIAKNWSIADTEGKVKIFMGVVIAVLFVYNLFGGK